MALNVVYETLFTGVFLFSTLLIDNSKKAKKTMENKEELKEKTRKPKLSTRSFQCSSIRLTLIPS